jgi:hypothetical protein
MQAAVVTMLVAKRPALDSLPVRWELRPDGVVYVEPTFKAGASDIAKIASELTRAMRGARTETYDIGTTYRVHEVSAQPSGVQVRFYGQHRLDSAFTEGGESA